MGTFSISGPAQFSETAGLATYTVQRTNGTDGAVTVDYATSDDNATVPSDYTSTSGTLSFADGNTTMTFQVPVIDDADVEGAESFLVQISNATGGASIGIGLITTTILDNDHPANDNFANATVIANASGSTSALAFNATAEANEPLFASGQTVWFNWTAPISGTAIFDSDGSAYATALSVFAGTTLQNVIHVGTSYSNPLTFTGRGRLVFAATAGTSYYIQIDSQNGALGTAQLAWSMTTSGGFEVAVESVKVFENLDANATLTIRRIGGTTGAVTLDYRLDDSLAVLPADYGTTATGSVDFADGEALKTITIPIAGDTSYEGLEDFFVALTNVTGGTPVLGNTLFAQILIVDDDDDPAFDNFQKAQLLVGTDVDANFDSTGADVDPGEPDISNTGAGVVWFKWVAPATGLARLNIGEIDDSTYGSGFTGILRMYTGTGVSNLTQGSTVRSDTGGQLDLQVIGGASYCFAVTAEGNGDGSGQGSFELNLHFSAGGTISAQGVTVNETDGTASLTLHRTNPGGIAQANLSARGGAATLGVDFGFGNSGLATVVFQPGETVKTFTFPIVDDFTIEGDEEIDIRIETKGDVISDVVNVSVLIRDDDDDPANDKFASAQLISGATGNAAGTLSGAEHETSEPDHGSATVWYRWTAPSAGVASFATTSQSPVASIFVYAGNTLAGLAPVAAGHGFFQNTIAAFAVTAGTVYQIAITDDGSGGAGNFAFNWNVSDNGSLFSIAADVAVHENAGSAVLTVTRSGVLDSPATVDFSTGDGSAAAGSDYTATTGTLAFAANDTTKTITVPIANDTTVEGDEYLTAQLSNPTGTAMLGTSSTGFVIILDNDDDPANNPFAAPAQLAGANGTEQSSNVGADNETGEPEHGGPGGASVWFTWTAPANGEVTFDTHGTFFDTLLAAYTGSALNALTPLASSDDNDPNVDTTSEISFMATAGTVYRIAVDGSSGDSGDITLNWRLRVPGTFQFASATFTQAEVNGNAVITVTRVTGSSGAAMVDFATAGGTATAGLDYTAATGTLFFDDGETSKTFMVPIHSDAIFEQDETVLITLSNPTSDAGLGLAAATLTITDNDVFIPLKSGYTGLVTNDTFDNSLTGGLTLKTDGKGAFTGSLVLGGEKLGLKGTFDGDGAATIKLTRKGGAQVTLHLQITAGGDEIAGTLVSGVKTATVSADRNVFGSDVPTAQFAGNFTLLIPGDRTAAAGAPKGDSAAAVSIGTNGLAKIVGSLADGTKLSLGVPVSKLGVLPLYAPLYKNGGSISGALQFRSQPGVSDGDGPVTWFKPNAFSIDTTGLLSIHKFAKGERVLSQLNATNGAAEFSAGLGNLPPAGLQQIINISEANVVSLPLVPAVKLKLKFVGLTGYFSGTFAQGANKPTPFQGVVFRAQGLSSGYFLAPNGAVIESGFVEIAPAN